MHKHRGNTLSTSMSYVCTYKSNDVVEGETVALLIAEDLLRAEAVEELVAKVVHAYLLESVYENELLLAVATCPEYDDMSLIAFAFSTLF